MANSVIQLKRSTVTAVPSALANGEVAYTSNGEVLFIGHPDGTSGPVAIGGRRYPGVLTANQALVANSTSGIDKVIVANLVPTAIYANGSVGSAGHILYSNGSATYWASAPTGDVTSVTAGSGLSGGGSTGDLTINVLANNGIVANTTGVFAKAANGISVDASGINVVGGSGLVSNATGVHIGSGNGISVSADAITVTGGSTLVVNATGVHVNTANLSIATSQLTGDITLGTQTTGNYVATITAGAGISGSSTTEGGTPTIAVVANNGIVANSTGVFVNANTAGGLVANSTGLSVKLGTGVTFDGSGNLTIGQAVTTTSNVTFNDITASGNLVVNGTLVTLDVETLQVEDPLIALARLNTSADTVDIGLYGTYNDGSTRYSGVFRDASNSDIWTFFSNTTVVPTTTVDTSGAGYALAGILAGTGRFNSGLTLPFLANNGVLIGQNTSSISAVTSTTEGHVLQISASGIPTFGMLDGGTF